MDAEKSFSSAEPLKALLTGFTFYADVKAETNPGSEKYFLAYSAVLTIPRGGR